MKDYYQILEVSPDADEDEIRKNYRRLAMKHHPDRNPDRPDAEEKFKEIAEAYGVLTDSNKRQQYDMARKMGGSFNANGQQGGFNYSQEDILKDLFNDPRFQQMFNGLLQEFARRGLRSGPTFVKKSFMGGKGGILFGGLYLFGSIAGPAILNSAKKNLPGKKSLLKSIGSTVGSLLSGSKQEEGGEQNSYPPLIDTTYTATLSSDEFRNGKTIQVVTQGPEGQERLKVKIPAGSRAGQRLRLKGKGVAGRDGRGDLFIQLEQG